MTSFRATPRALQVWAKAHGVSREALGELMGLFMAAEPQAARNVVQNENETDVGALIRVEASKAGGRLWRNNVGAATTPDGRPVRYGLANESARINAVLKSSDLIGIMPLLIEPYHVGTIVGRFTAREVKRPGWHYTGTEREAAQFNFLTLVAALGGDATFATGPGTL